MFHPSLGVFVCVADCGSFTKAAERLYLSSPAVMKRINSLEEHLNLRLVERSKQGVRLTPAGEIIYKYAKIIMEQSEHAVAAARQAAEEGTLTLRVGTSLLNPCRPFMELWYHLCSRFPKYQIQVVSLGDETTGILAELPKLGKKFDFFIGAYNDELGLQLCNQYYMGDYHVCCAVHRNHLLAQKERLRMEDLYGEVLMIGERGNNHRIDALRDELEHRHPQIAIENTNPYYNLDVFNDCAEKNHVLLTLECWSEIHPAMVTLPVEWNYTMPYGLVYAKEPERKVMFLLDALRERMEGADLY